ncbi:MAG: tRNA methyltransferase [Desulfovibrionaceae bacterium]|nr:tRNA methyltransferase [Desulfovibrionaceae bacterium]
MTYVRERTEGRRERLKSVLTMRQPDLTLILANIHDPHNVSAIYRSADAFGLMRVHLYYTDTAFPILSRRTSASARKWVETVRHRSVEELSAALPDHQILATSCSPLAKPLGDWDLTKKTAIIMGNEHSGVPDDLLTIAHGEVYIPMRGMIQSLNVSVAAAILLYEAARQRDAAGMYDKTSLSPYDFEKAYQAWLER